MRTASIVDLSDRLDAGLDWLSKSHRRAALALVAVTLVCLLPGFASLPPIDRDESRFAQATKQMIETGDYVDIRLQDRVRYRKPVGIYWLQAAAVHGAEAIGFDAARNRIVFYRLPSLFAAVGAVLLTYWAALAVVSRRYALLAGLMMAGSILLGVEARLATVDAALLLTAVAALGALARLYLAAGPPPAAPVREWGLATLFWTAIAASVLLKGPVVPVIAMLTATALAIADRSARWLLRLKPAVGLLWALVLILPWFLAIQWRSEGGFLEQSVGRDLLGRIFQPAEGHGAPPGYYWLLFWITFWPAAPLAVLATPFAWAHRREPPLRFLLAWIVPAWIMIEVIVTKLPHYVLPLYPAVAILIALALERAAPLDRPARWASWLWPLLAVLMPIAAIALVVAFDGGFGLGFWLFAPLAVVLALLARRLFAEDGADRGLALAVVAAAAFHIALFSVLPKVQGLFPTAPMVAAARAVPCDDPAIAAAGFHEPSLVFTAGTETLLTSGAGAAEFLRLGGCRVALVERRQQRAFDNRAQAIGLLYTRAGEVRGFNYSNGRRVRVLVLIAREGR